MRHFFEQGWRVGFIREEEMLSPVLFFERLDLSHDILSWQAPVMVKVALSVIAEGAPAPIAPASGQIRKNANRYEVAVQRQAIEVRKRKRRGLLRVDFLIHLDAGGIAIHQVGYRCQASLTAQRFKEPEQGMFPLVHERGFKDLGEQSRMIGKLFRKSGAD